VGLCVQIAVQKMLLNVQQIEYVMLDVEDAVIIEMLQQGIILQAALTRYVIILQLRYRMRIGTMVHRTKTLMLPSGAVISGR
jgi:hypothetical protein